MKYLCFFKQNSFFLFLSFFYVWNFSFSQQPTAVETIVQKGHIQPVSSLAWHPSGDYFVTGSEDHSILLWDAKTGKQIRSYNYHTGKILNLIFSKDGNQLLTSAADNRVLVIDVLSGNLLEEYFPDFENSYPMSVSYSYTEKYILVGDNRDHLVVFDRDKKTVENHHKGFSAPVHSLTLSTDEKYRFVFKNYKASYLIDQISGDSILIEFDKPYHYSFSPDGKYLAIASEKLFAKIYEIPSGKELKTIESSGKCDGCKFKIVFSPDGKYFATTDRFEGLSIYKTDSWKKVAENKSFSESYSSISFTEKGAYVILGNSNEYQLVNTENGKLSFDIKNEFIDFSKPQVDPGEKYVLVADAYFSVSTYALGSKKKEKNYRGFLNQEVALDKQFNYGSWHDKGILNHIKYKPALAVSSDGTLMAQGKTDSSITVFNLKTGRHLPSFVGHNEKVMSVAFHPNKSEMVTGDAKGNMIVWNTATGKIIHQFRGHTGLIFDLVYSENGEELLSSSWDGTVKHWIFTAEQVKSLGYINLNGTSAYKIAFSPRDLYILVGDVSENLVVYETDTKKEVKRFVGHQNTISDFLFLDTDSHSPTLVTASRDGWVKIWDFNSGMLIDKVGSERQSAVLSLALNREKNQLFFGSSDRNIYVYDLDMRKIKHRFYAHQTGVNYLRYNSGSLISKSVEGEVKFWNMQSDNLEEKLTFFQMDAKEWLITQPDGYFDGSKKAMEQINYVSGMKALEVGSFFKKYYHPGLYEYLNSGNSLRGDDKSMEQLLDDGVPRFDIYFYDFQGELVAARNDQRYTHNSSSVSLEIHSVNDFKNVQSILVFNNGKLIKGNAYEEDITFRTLSKKRPLEVSLVPGKNQIGIEITTEDGLTTPQQTIDFFFDTLSGKTELFILSIGINDYENSNYNLKYAMNDAQTFAKTVKGVASDIYYKVNDFQLVNKKVTKENVMRLIEEINSQMGPEDVFVFFYAGHGMMYQNKDNTSDFFLIMSDITNLYGEKSVLENKGISAKDLLEISKKIAAQKQVFVLDACQSGAALKGLAVRGVQREKTLAQLARNTGTFFLTASQDIEFANESGTLKHGIFTYAMLEVLTGKSDDFLKDDVISIYQLKSYVESRVPELSKIHQGTSQYPTGYSFGNDFPIGILK